MEIVGTHVMLEMSMIKCVRDIKGNLCQVECYFVLKQYLRPHVVIHITGYSGADMANLCREAALGPIRCMAFDEIESISADQVNIFYILFI